MKKLTVIIILVAFILQGCAGVAVVRQGFIRRPNLGTWINILPGGQVEITKVEKKSAAEKGGIRKGDIIKSWEGRPLNVKKLIDFFNLLYEKEPNDRVLLTIQRGSKEINRKVSLGFFDYLKEIDMILRILAGGERVNLVILTGEISNVRIEDPAILEEWKKTVRTQLLTEHENIYLSWFNVWENFALVDRQRVTKILEELEIGLSGLISAETQNKLGELLGATHIVFVSYSRTPAGGRNKDMKPIRLIEIKTGKVLVSYYLDL